MKSCEKHDHLSRNQGNSFWQCWVNMKSCHYIAMLSAIVFVTLRNAVIVLPYLCMSLGVCVGSGAHVQSQGFSVKMRDILALSQYRQYYSMCWTLRHIKPYWMSKMKLDRSACMCAMCSFGITTRVEQRYSVNDWVKNMQCYNLIEMHTTHCSWQMDWRMDWHAAASCHASWHGRVLQWQPGQLILHKQEYEDFPFYSYLIPMNFPNDKWQQ